MPIVLRLVKGLPLTFEELDGNFSDLDTRTLTLDETVELQTLAIGGLETDLSTLEGTVTTLSGTVSTQGGAIATLDGRVDDAETDIGLLDGRVDTLETNLGALTASDVDYVNTTSGLTATDVQAAIDEVVADLLGYVTLGTVQTLTAPKRLNIATANTGDFDFAAAGNFICTPTGPITLTLTVGSGDITGQSGFIKLENPSGYAIGAVSGFDFDSTFLATISAAGSYLIAYFAESNTKVNLVASGALT